MMKTILASTMLICKSVCYISRAITKVTKCNIPENKSESSFDSHSEVEKDLKKFFSLVTLKMSPGH